MKKLIIALLIFCNQVEADEKQSYFLSCKGANYLRDPSNYDYLIKKNEQTNSYEIRDKNLYIPIAHSKGILIPPIDYGEHNVLYFVENHPQYSIMKEYYLSLDRISGNIEETHIQKIDPSNPSRHTFQGKCTVIRKKLF